MHLYRLPRCSDDISFVRRHYGNRHRRRAELWAEQPRGPASVGRSLPAIRRDQPTGPDRDELKLVLNGRSEQSGGGAEGLGQVEKLGG